MGRSLSGFSSAVLAEYISQRVYKPDIKDLEYIEAMHEYMEIKKKIDKIIERKKAKKPLPTNGGQRIRVLKAMLNDSKKLDALWARQEELNKIMFPDIYGDKEEQK